MRYWCQTIGRTLETKAEGDQVWNIEEKNQMRIRIVHALMMLLGAPEPEVVAHGVKKECDAWNNAYSDGKLCEKCGRGDLTHQSGYSSGPGLSGESHYSYYECPTCEHKQKDFWYDGSEARWRYGVSSIYGYHYAGHALFFFLLSKIWASPWKFWQ